MDHVIVSPDSLHSYLQTVVNLIGLERNLPVYVEFYPAIHMESDPILCHILGFLKVIKVVQELYKGPLVVVVAPASHIDGATQHDYLKSKQQNASLQVMIYMLGYGYGVPVLMTPIQQIEGENSPLVIKHDHWEDEPLYSSNLVKTREFYGRLAYVLSMASTFIRETEDKCLPSSLNQ